MPTICSFYGIAIRMFFNDHAPLQWHDEIDPEMGERLGEYFVRYAESQCQELGFSPEEVRAWQPPAKAAAKLETQAARGV